MPISFGETSDSSGAYVRVNLPQNRWTLNAGADPQTIDMVKGIAIDIKNVKFGWLKIAVGMRDWQEWPAPSQPTAKPQEIDAEGSLAYKQGFDQPRVTRQQIGQPHSQTTRSASKHTPRPSTWARHHRGKGSR